MRLYTDSPAQPHATCRRQTHRQHHHRQVPQSARPTTRLAMAEARQRPRGVRLLVAYRPSSFLGDRPARVEPGRLQSSPPRVVSELNLVNSQLGYRARKTVDIEAGSIISLTVKPPNGRVSVTALPWAQVWIDGKSVGETPLANLAVPIGDHEITFRHPQLGERDWKRPPSGQTRRRASACRSSGSRCLQSGSTNWMGVLRKWRDFLGRGDTLRG